ncbi:MAG: hypothetical protein JO117_07365 [Verrucomicrobia bacterium]|nr:hypothetical protein [Verrucomicrobiota bacterium]MBV9657608.1 hypothetical protein [Verrucomicrobiota bacterium]
MKFPALFLCPFLGLASKARRRYGESTNRQPRQVAGFDFKVSVSVTLLREDTVERLIEPTMQPSTASAAKKL